LGSYFVFDFGVLHLNDEERRRFAAVDIPFALAAKDRVLARIVAAP
jgi:hypothetical protein